MATGMPGSEFMKMQQEAERRVMDMQRRAQSKVSGEKAPPPLKPEPIPQKPLPQKGNSFLDLLNIRSFLESKDTSLVLMVLALLSGEQSDPLLMLALLYIVM